MLNESNHNVNLLNFTDLLATWNQCSSCANAEEQEIVEDIIDAYYAGRADYADLYDWDGIIQKYTTHPLFDRFGITSALNNLKKLI